MKPLCFGLFMAGLLTVGAAAFGQESSLLARCLGEPRSAYAKAFEDTTTSMEKTPHGTVSVARYKTGSAMIEVMQKAGARRPEMVNVYYYQEPKRDWKLALKDIGLPSSGVVAKEDSKHRVHLTHIRAAKQLRIEAVYVPLGPENSNGPELHLTLR